MRRSVRVALLLAVCALLAGAAVFAVACGSGEEGPATTIAATETTAAPAGGATDGGIVVTGLVDNAGTLLPTDLEAMNLSTVVAEHPTKGAAEYTGVIFSELMSMLGVQPGAITVTLAGSDGSTAEIRLADMDANAMLAFDDDGTYDAVMPGLDGESWVNDIVSMEFK